MFQFRQLLRPQTALRAASLSQKPSSFSLPQTRAIHRVPQLTHDEFFKTNGVPEFLSPDQFDMAWTEYQTHLIERLNRLTQNTKDNDATPFELITTYSRTPERAALFNYASMASNNHFFFNSLSPTPTEIPSTLLRTINDTCSSVESLKRDFLATANSMFGPGFVWLAKNMEKEGLLHIFCTYNAGSPYPAAHARQQPVDKATQAQKTGVGNQNAGAMGAYSANKKTLAPGALNLEPILCVNTWEHVYMMDYGVTGKAEYLERWWNRINWKSVSDHYDSLGVVSATSGRPRGQGVLRL